ncbi:MAG: efflux RND transporter periplasmic adaptor subunit [Candidatus Aminicenantes bacterium]|nr:efflux RND transporter periplasmic adaptor subunit [Candidatus Aminicenantes bacterium]
MEKMKQFLLNFWNSNLRWPMIIALIVTFSLGLLINGGTEPGRSAQQRADLEGQAATKVQIWTCSMHPQIKQPNPGKCPICGMDLIPVAISEDSQVGKQELKLSENAMKLAGIQTATVQRRYVTTEVRLAGKVAFDETRLKVITAWVPGRIDHLYVDFTGAEVKKGEHLVDLYSPDLISAQQELIEAKKTPLKNLDAVREKLRLWGLTHSQIKEMEQSEKTKDHLTIFSPIGGIVVQKNASEGMYVQTGSRIYTIADLSFVWIELDAYESDLAWVRYGQAVEFEVEAYPGERFAGKIAFIDPVLDPATRTVKVRVNAANPQGKLKPEMFVRAIVRSKLSSGGKVLDEELMDKWISPMHPEIVKDRPGKCDICGMPLVRAEKLGYLASKNKNTEMPLVIPASAPLLTGTRAVVYLAVAGKKGIFAARQVSLGPRVGDDYIVSAGLSEGEEVVVNGAFKIDSDLQIQGKPSMMNPEGGAPVSGHQQHETHNQAKKETPENNNRKSEPSKKQAIAQEFNRTVDRVAQAYFSIQDALSRDALENAQKAAANLLNEMAVADMKLLKGEAHMDWMKLEAGIKTSTQDLKSAKDIEGARTSFDKLTEPVTTAITEFGGGKTAVYRFHCPMAFDNKGAYWLQDHRQTRNPYFGASMLTCQDSIETMVAAEKEK